MIGHGRTSVLVALLHHEATQVALTARSLASATGLAVSTVHGHLVRLRKMGLVAWTTGERGTLRSAVAVVVPS